MKKNSIVYLLFIGAIFLLFKNWIFTPELIGGDWPYFYAENIKAFSFLPPAWDSIHGDGFGGPHVVYPLDSFLYFTAWLFSNVLQISWPLVYKICWFALLIFLALFSISHLLKQLRFNISSVVALPGMFLYVANTYILMVVGGGQLGVGLGYAIAPLVLSFFIRVISSFDSTAVKQKKITHKKLIYYSLLAGLILSIQVLFDIRIAYVTLCAVGLYYILSIKKNVFQFLYTFPVPLVVTALLHTFWLLPFFFIGQTTISQMGAGYTSTNALSFFSFAFFENAIGLLQPNWPDNIFGKVGFMRPEFLVIPLLVFSILLFVQDKKIDSFQKRSIIFFMLVALAGIFLAKGANDPFGSFNMWLFETVPGFVMFRDPTKWYTLIAISYAVLIPLNLNFINRKIESQKKYKLQFLTKHNILVILVLGILIVLIRPAIIGELGGTFAKHSIPDEYILLKNELLADDSFSRTMWLPKYQRFGFANQNHPAVEPIRALQATNSAEAITQIKQRNAQKKLSELSIKYIIVPIDSEKEIFLKDRKYNKKERDTIIQALDELDWLQKDKQFSDLTVYQLKNHKDRLWLQQSGNISYKRVSSTEYKLHLETNNNKLIFNESYSPYWTLHIRDKQLRSENYNGMNSFDVPNIQEEVSLVYSLHEFHEIGRIISFIMLFALLWALRIYKVKKSMLELEKVK